MARTSHKLVKIDALNRESSYKESLARLWAAQALSREASALLARHKDESALFLLNQAEIICPELVSISVEKAWIYLRRGENKEAISTAKLVRERAPYYADFVGLKRAIDDLSQTSAKQAKSRT